MYISYILTLLKGERRRRRRNGVQSLKTFLSISFEEQPATAECKNIFFFFSFKLEGVGV